MTALQTTPSETVRTESTNGALARGRPAELRITNDDGPFANLLDTAKFEHVWRVAQMYAKSKLVPEQFRNAPEDCFIALQMSVRLGVDPFMFMQKTYVVHGKPGMEAQLAIALVNARGPFKGAIQWKLEGQGDTRQATAFAVHKETNEVCSCTVSMAIAKAEGWISKSGSKWVTMPDQMLRYRSASWLCKLYAPECLMGMQMADEIEDVGPERVQVQNLASLPEGRGSFRSDPAPETVDTATGEVEPAKVGDVATTAVDEAQAKIREQRRANGAAASAAANAPASDATGTPVEEVAKPKKSSAEAKADLDRAKHGCRVGTLGCSSDISIDPATKKPVCSNHAPQS